ncbi:unnamed protein product [Rotaria sordida]|uniref:Uncharacterized protein n=1 Tax=Rotaria sordida TaxID=392033 RepID=A0A813YM36_9BILA|nr:unnamed protein product [Rotaria sordida]CAF0898135.1 unnamed protein product [Rotaria sordida]CAF1241400.1 unnamed protein product [Rotaria sordida]CAF3630723.1 unnamed protein product [Rotaria sordida]
MNRTLSNLKISSFNDVNHLQKYEICRKQSACYLLIPPPRPPTIPELFLTTTCKLSLSSSSTLTNFRQRTTTDSSYLTIISIILGILIALTSTCLILFLLGVKFRFHYKLRYHHRRRTTDINSVNSSIRETNNSDVTFIKTTNTNSNLGSNSNDGGDGCASFSSIVPTSYECSTPLTTTTTIPHNQYPSLTMTNNSNLSLHMMHSQQYLNSDNISLSHRNSTNIYEEIRPTFDHHHCCCCSCTLAYYQKQQQQQQQCISNNRHLTPHYYTCEPPSPLSTTTSSTIVCQSCLLETLHRKQQQTSSIMNCACRNFFIPIK